MRKNLKAKTLESLSSVLPITAIVLVLSFTLAPEMPAGTLMMFLLGAILLVVGMGLFSLGADMAMMPMGDGVGGEVVRIGKRSIWPIIPLVFLIGAFITMAEPDLQVLATQVPAVPDMVIILTVAAGVGLFLVLSAINTIKEKFSLNTLLIFFYIFVFLLAFIVPDEFLAVAFDSGGVTTGPITVPFLMATSREAGEQFLHGFPEYMQEVAVGLLPVVVFFVIFQIFSLHLKKDALIRLIIGVAYTYVGLVLFLTGVNVGFMPAGTYLGSTIGSLEYNWILIPIGMVVGYFIVAAEPAVHVLNKQVEEVTGGAIPQRAMNLSLSIGVALSVGLAMTRVVTGISILWFLVPGYAIALLLSFKVPKIFTAIAFDSGGVASGPMTATFLLPFAMGACNALGGDVLTDAFGIVAMVAMTPLVTIQCLGAFYQRRLRRTVEVTEAETSTMSSEDIIEFDDV